MIRRLRISWPTQLGDGRPVRLLALSDERLEVMADERNRAALGRIDAVLGCGDLEPDYLSFLGDAFRAPLLYVKGNHDRGAAWEAGQTFVPVPVSGDFEQVAGITLAGLSWPFPPNRSAERDERGAWWQALDVALRAAIRRTRPQIVLSHVPPEGLGDIPTDHYHAGFSAYRWLCRRLRPVLWLHGHTTMAAAEHWRTHLGPTTLLNVTGGVLIQLEPARGSRARVAGHAE